MAEQSTFENELPKKSTVEYVRGLDANGNPILINKSDLASVVGGLIGLVTSSKAGLCDTIIYKTSAKNTTKTTAGYTIIANAGNICVGAIFYTGSRQDNVMFYTGIITICHFDSIVKIQKTRLVGDREIDIYYKLDSSNNLQIAVSDFSTQYLYHNAISNSPSIQINMGNLATIEGWTKVS